MLSSGLETPFADPHASSGAPSESELLFRGLVEAAFDAVAISIDGAFVEANQALARLLGYERAEDLIGLTPDDICAPDDARLAREHIRTQYDRPYEVQGCRQDGSLFPMEIVGRNIVYRGRQARITGFRDISRRRMAEETLLRQKALVELLQQVAVAANEATGAREALACTLDTVCAFTGWPVGHAWLADDGHRLTPGEIWHLSDPDRFAAFRAATERAGPADAPSRPGNAFASRRPVWIADATARRDCERLREAAAQRLRAAFALPVHAGGRLAAVLEFFSEAAAEPDPLLLDVLEHVPDDAAVVRGFHRLLKPGGVALVTVPASMALWSDWDVALHHFRRYDRAGLRALFPAGDWEVVYLNYTNVVVYPAVWLLRRWRGWFPARPGARRSEDRLPAKPVNALLRWIFVTLAFWRVPFPTGVSLLLVARRRD